MKKRVCSVLLAAVLCVTMLSVVALATESTDCNHTYTDKHYVANANGINHSPKCDNCGYVDISSSSQHCDNGSNSKYKDGKCDYCDAELAVSFNDSSRTICATTWEAAFKEISSGSGTLYPIKNVTDGITYNEKGNVTINLAGLTINKLKVTKGTLTITGSGTITKLEVSGGTVQLSGGTYGEITGADKKDLLASGYVFDTDGKTVKKAPIERVTASVTANIDAKYGYTEAPVLTATVASEGVENVTYQWLDSNKQTITGATGSSYTLPTGLDAGTYTYRCTATYQGYTLTSNDVTVTIAKADGPQLGTINVNQVFNDTDSKTINIYDYIGTELNQLAKDAGKLRFHSGSYSSSPENMIEGGWDVDVNTGAITYQLANGLSVNDEIIITMTVGYNEAYSKNHEDATVTVNITLTKITPTGTPNYTPITSSGKTLADAHLDADNNAFSVPGTVKWVGETDELDPSTVPVEKDKAYTWKFTPLLDNYESITGTIIPPPEQTTDNTTNPATGAAAQPALGLALLAVAAICVDSKLRRQ